MIGGLVLLVLAAVAYAWSLECDELYCRTTWAWHLKVQHRPSGLRYRWLCRYHARHPSKLTVSMFGK